MSGHSKWATIKRKKGAADAARGAKFSRLIKEITVAARLGGGDANGNPRLRTAVLAARGANMPNANIDRAIAKATGDGEGAQLEESLWEAYGPGGSSLLVMVMTDNKNRTASEIRHLFQKGGATVADVGSVAYKFTRRGQMYINAEAGLDEDTVMMTALDSGAEDVRGDGEGWEVLTDPASLYEVREALEKGGLKPTEVRLAYIPNNTIPVTGDKASSLLKLIDKLEDHDDVQNVFSDYEIDDAELERLNAEE